MHDWSHQIAQPWGRLLCLGLWLMLTAQGMAQAPARLQPRGAMGTNGGGAGNTAAQAPRPLADNAHISLDARGLSVDIQEQGVAAVVERIAALAEIELKHLDGLPNRRLSIRFTSLPVVEGLRRIFRAADVPGYLLITDTQGKSARVQRIVFLQEEGTPGGGRAAQRSAALAAAQVPRPPVVAPPPAAPPPAPPQEEQNAGSGQPNGTVFDEIKSNAAARRLLSQMMHPNDQVRERAMEGLVRLMREDNKQRELMDLLEPLMEDLGSEDQATQEGAREEIRKMLAR